MLVDDLVLYPVTSVETVGNRKKWKAFIIYSVHVPHYLDEVFRNLTSLIIVDIRFIKKFGFQLALQT